MKKYDLIVVGGGITGVAAAVSAKRLGIDVLLVDKSGALGGAMSNSLVYPFMYYATKSPDASGHEKVLCDGIFTEMRKRHAKYSTDKHNFSPEHFKFTFDEMISEAGVDVLFHGSVFDVTTEDGKISSIKVATKQGVTEYASNLFIDATGDGQIFYLAGCDYQIDREDDGFCQPMTTCFRMSGVDIDAFYADLPRLQKLYKEKHETGEIKNPRENILVFNGIGTGILHFNTTRVIKLDPTNPLDVSRSEIMARSQIAEMEQFLKENCDAFKDSTIISIASEIGIRESRKLKGEHILTVEELKDCTKFDDRIALGNYDVDIHNPTGSGTEHYYFKAGEYYSIPYRSLLPKEISNLLVAGRCISATHEAQASVRIMPICACMGQAAGTAAAVCIQTGCNPHNVDVSAVQALLRENGAAID